MKRRTGVLLAAAAGFGIAMLLMSAAIYLGYCEAYRTGAEEVTVRLCGVSIYRISRSAGGYGGMGIGPHMGAVCAAGSSAAAAAEEAFRKLRQMLK